VKLYSIPSVCATVQADLLQAVTDSRSAQDHGYHLFSMKPSNSPVLFSVWKNNLTPIPFALASTKYNKYIHTTKTITLTYGIFHIDAVAPRQYCSRISASIAANNYRDYRPASQAVFSVVYTSITTVSQYYFQCGKKIYRRGRIDAYTYPDYRLALQAVFSVIYVSCHYQSAWIQ